MEIKEFELQSMTTVYQLLTWLYAQGYRRVEDQIHIANEIFEWRYK